MAMGAAAELLGVSARQIRRLQSRFREKGFEAVIHGNTGRVPSNRTNQALVEQINTLAGPDGKYHTTACPPASTTIATPLPFYQTSSSATTLASPIARPTWARDPPDPNTAWVPLPAELDLNYYFAIRHSRKVRPDHCISWSGQRPSSGQDIHSYPLCLENSGGAVASEAAASSGHFR